MNCQKTHARVAIISQYQSWAGECRSQRGRKGAGAGGRGQSRLQHKTNSAISARNCCKLRFKAKAGVKTTFTVQQQQIRLSIYLSLFNIKGSIEYRGRGREEGREREGQGVGVH